MKRSDLMIKMISAVILAAILCYIGFSAAETLISPFKTTLAVSIAVSEGFSAEGLAARQETVITSSGQTLDVVAKSGEKLGAGGTVAKRYTDQSSLLQIREAEDLDARIEELEKIQNSGAASGDMLSLDEKIKDGIYGLVYSARSRDFTNLSSQTSELEARMLSFTGGADSLQTRLLNLRQQRIGLGSVGASGSALAAPVSGIFSPTVDGFESLTPDDLLSATATSLSALLAQDVQPPANAVGKLVTDPRWYFALIAEAADAEKLKDSAEETVTATFGRYLGLEVEMSVESISSSANGKYVVVLSSDRDLADTLAVRKQTVNVIFNQHSGLRVPKSALCLDKDGTTYVYVLTGAVAERKNVEIVYQSDDYVVVSADKSTSDGLRAGERIITTTKDIYNGKVVQ